MHSQSREKKKKSNTFLCRFVFRFLLDDFIKKINEEWGERKVLEQTNIPNNRVYTVRCYQYKSFQMDLKRVLVCHSQEKSNTERFDIRLEILVVNESRDQTLHIFYFKLDTSRMTPKTFSKT
jgi:hypothetical protein